MAHEVTGSAANAHVDDIGLRCPRCKYNLTGLSQARCPECGASFDWEAVRREAANPPRIPFERARRWWKIPMFAVTWVTLLLAPWAFARQVVARVSTGHALVFGGVCFASTLLAMFFDAPLSIVVAWLATVFIYLPIQTLCIAVADVVGWRRFGDTLWFWLLVGFYTSAVMMTECCYGPPPLVLSSLIDVVAGPRVVSWLGDDMFTYSLSSVVWWAQLGVWVAALGCVFFLRQRRPRRNVPALLLATLTMMAGILVLYATVFEYVGVPIGEWCVENLE